MSVFDSLNNTTNKATDIGERYINKSHQYLRLKIFQQLTYSMSLATKVLLIGGLIFVGLVFGSIALAVKFGEIFDSMSLGCLLVGIIYLILAFLAFTVRSKIDSIIIKKIGKNFFN